MYGRQAKSIAEQMNVSVKEATSVIKNFFQEFPKVADYIVYVQDHAFEKGYVETVGGRRRRLPDMQLEPYEFSYIDASKSASFNPLDFSTEQDLNTEVPELVVEKYWSEMEAAWGFSKKREVQSRAEAEGIKIVDNGGKIADAERQCLNSVIQGQLGPISIERAKRCA